MLNRIVLLRLEMPSVHKLLLLDLLPLDNGCNHRSNTVLCRLDRDVLQHQVTRQAVSQRGQRALGLKEARHQKGQGLGEKEGQARAGQS